ncbi:MAG: hypothetical protein WAO08_10375 [Hyphomicrobiaceae bacterium]
MQAVLGASPLRFRIDDAAIVLGRVKAEPDGGGHGAPGTVGLGPAQRTLQLAEAWETFRPWIETTNPRMAFVVAAT